MDAAGNVPLLAYPTHELRDLTAALSLADYVICSDGGAMHIAAALGKPVLCFFGDSDATRWHPWGVPYRLLQPDSRDAMDISLAAALQAFRELQRET
jgi:ADP-heptose:LPS heptosyltransferase